MKCFFKSNGQSQTQESYAMMRKGWINSNKKRKNWIDWAKVLGMFLVVYGHCFPQSMTDFVYAFNVPVFFVVSGYLCKKETSFDICWKKTLSNLVIPY